MTDNEIEKGIPLSKDDDFWLKKMKDMSGDSIKSIEESAKQIIGMITVMEALYTAVLAFSGIKEMSSGGMLASAFYVSPILLWLVSLYFAIRVLKSKTYEFYSNSPDDCKNKFYSIAKDKYRDLNLSFLFLALSFGIAIVGIFYWLYCGIK